MVSIESVHTPNASLAANYGFVKRDDMDIPHGISLAGVIIGLIVIAVGAFGNVLIMLSVILSKPLCKSSSIFVVSLASCDLFQTLMVKPLYVYTYITGEWLFGRQMCLYALFASNLAILESILHVAAIAFYRYMFICHHKKAQRFQTLRMVLINLVLIYILPILMVLLPSIPRLRNTDVVFNKKIMFCSFVKHSEFRLAGVLKKVLFLFAAAIFLCFCYMRIMFKVRDSRLSINEQGTFSSSRIRREMSLLKMVILTFVAFIVCYLPVSILYGVDTHRTFPFISYFISVVLLWLSSSINWIIYGCVNEQYCMAYRYILCGKRHRGRYTDNNSLTPRSSRRQSNGGNFTQSKSRKNNTNSKKKYVTINADLENGKSISIASDFEEGKDMIKLGPL